MPPPLNHRHVRRVAWAGWIASALEYYDFFLYATAAALVLGPLFFPASEPGATTLVSLASVGAGYVARPAGALLFGFLGDLCGRRFVMSLSLVLMGGATFLIGALPTYAEIGLAAPILLVSLRLVQGLAVSAEHASASVLALETARASRRGLLASLTLSGTQAGLLAGSAVFLLLSSVLDEGDLMAWGWRIPFLASAVVVAVGLWVRTHLPESEAFLAVAQPPRGGGYRPLAGRLWRHYKGAVARVILAAQVSVVSSVVGVFSLSWAVNHLQWTRPTALAIQLSSACVGMLVIPLWAGLSDRIGRKPVFIAGTMSSGILIWPYFWALGQMDVALALVCGILLAGVAYSAANGVWPALYGEMFGTEVRLSGMAIGTQIGFTIAGQAPAVAAWLVGGVSENWIPVAGLVSIACLISVAAVCGVPETSRTGLSELGRK